MVLHFSGSGVKPWDLVDQLPDVPTTPGKHLEGAAVAPRWRFTCGAPGYEDRERLWGAIVEWLAQLSAVVARSMAN